MAVFQQITIVMEYIWITLNCTVVKYSITWVQKKEEEFVWDKAEWKVI